MTQCNMINSLNQIKNIKLKVSKYRKKKWNSQLQKTNETREKIILRAFRTVFEVFRSFFGRIDNSKNCFWDLLSFILQLCFDVFKVGKKA